MPKKPSEQPSMNREEIEQLIVQVVRRELSNLAGSVDATPLERHKGTGTTVVKKTVSVPSGLWAQLRRECPGPASPHIAEALRIYLAMRKGQQT